MKEIKISVIFWATVWKGCKDGKLCNDFQASSLWCYVNFMLSIYIENNRFKESYCI